MSDDLYVHHHLKTNATQEKNLIALARHLVTNAAAIDARHGLLFGMTTMRRFRPLPAAIVGAPEMPMPPLAYAPLAGVAPKPGDDWRSYSARSFSIQFGQPFIHWLQAAPWKETEGSAMGAGLRIAYGLDYGVLHDYQEIASGHGRHRLRRQRLPLGQTRHAAAGIHRRPMAEAATVAVARRRGGGADQPGRIYAEEEGEA